MPYVSVYVDALDVLEDVSDEDLIAEFKDRKLSFSAVGDGYRLDRVIDDLKDAVFEINMGRKEYALRMIEKMIDHIESADRALSNQAINYSTISKPVDPPSS